jgi:hypothetical protein
MFLNGKVAVHKITSANEPEKTSRRLDTDHAAKNIITQS